MGEVNPARAGMIRVASGVPGNAVIVNPARAGMIRFSTAPSGSEMSKPRASGDDPDADLYPQGGFQ